MSLYHPAREAGENDSKFLMAQWIWPNLLCGMIEKGKRPLPM
jgi:hypothetical protein